ncbi:PspA/IM30 family protein [Thermodesulforhabdus norvegica]|uniref:Phage shock protein A (PspA) family protein n=1 Tax=Thermodesulforhabdus norvegica TaxID=39841 RepID=A0A1I4V6F0_9BACT|nr:PspA/IM30 family protein [Thermodesulforhabdus norvegica]SFM96748.1 phage shock protein A (PspA) family protein [Thermodesulforhabdus norvegica]
MAGILKRLFKVGQAEMHSVVDKLEDPIKLTEQGIRDLKKDLSAALTSLAEVKALAIRLKKQMEDAKAAAKDYERKALMLLEKAKKGELEVSEAERLAMEALTRKQECESRAAQLAADYEAQNNMATQLQAKVEHLKREITKYENELITLKARAKTAQSMRKINQQLAKIDSSGTLAMLERMKQKVQEEESLAEAYGRIASETASVDDKIDQALATPSSAGAVTELEELKKRLGM